MRIGLYSPFFGSAIGGGEKYLGVAAEALRDAYPQHQVEIVSPLPVDRKRYERMLGLDFSGIKFNTGSFQVNKLSRWIRRFPLIRRYADLYVGYRSVTWTRDYDLLLSMVYVMPAASQARRGVILCQFPYELGADQSSRWGWAAPLYRLYTLPYEFLKRRLLGREEDSFQQVICQSEYVRGWTREYWKRNSLVVNPPIDVPTLEPDFAAKEQIILSVGRFFPSGHSKRQEIMLRIFRELCNAGLTGWEFHLAGSLNRSHPADVRYFEEVCQLAEGYPVHIHVDASLEMIQNLYAKSSIYWHAAGYGVNASKNPIDLEHFGMTTAEAMGYGTVPVAIGRGGQIEVVTDGVDGYLWNTLEELTSKTTELINDPLLRERMGRTARQTSFRFSRLHFKQQMSAAVHPLVMELEREQGKQVGQVKVSR
ncbi:MAG: glycosyltransferase family 4 protein [Candidatus Dormibacteraceae bacterium]